MEVSDRLETAGMNPQDGGADESDPLIAEKERRPPTRLVALLAGIAFFDGSDYMLLPATFLALERDLQLTPSNLGYMLLAQTLSMAVTAPMWAIATDRNLISRKNALVTGCFGWSMLSMALALAPGSLWVIVPLRVLNGMFMSTMLPTSQGLIADTTSELLRGRMFGYVEMCWDWGRMVAMLVATPISVATAMGFAGWRVVFFGFGVLSFLFSVVLVFCFEEPHREIEERPVHLGEELANLARYFKIPTFGLIVAQGLFGSAPWHAFGFIPMYLRLSGLDPVATSSIVAANIFCVGLGTIAGGFIADWMATKFGMHGRPLAAQISIFLCVPLCILIFYGIKPGADTQVQLGACFVLLGLLGSWTCAGVKRPMLSEIVEDSDRAKVVAWDAAWEGASASLFGAPAVAFLAEHCFNYPISHAETAFNMGKQHAVDLAKAESLGKALCLSTAGPWFVCFLLFSFVHLTYPKDVQAVEERRKAKKGL